MPGTQTGPNEGVHGGTLIAISGVPVFAAEIEKFDVSLLVGILDTTGHGDGPAGSKRTEGESGTWKGVGFVKDDQPPLPTYLAAATGTVRVVHTMLNTPDGDGADINYIEFPAIFSAVTLTHEPDEHRWRCDFTFTKSGAVTNPWSTAGGSVTSPALPATLTIKDVLEGLAKTWDPQGQNTAQVQAWDIKGFPNTHAGELSAIRGVLLSAAAITPLSGMSLDVLRFVRTGAMGARATAAFDYRNSVQKIEASHWLTATDPADIDGEHTEADVYSTGTTPSAPAAPSGLKLVAYTDLPTRNPAEMVRIYRYGRMTTKDQEELGRLTTETDPADIDGSHVEAVVYATGGAVPSTPAAPSGLKIVNIRDIITRNPAKSVRIFSYGRMNTEDQEELGRLTTTTDQADLGTSHVEAVVFPTGTPPSTPSAPTNLKLDRYTDIITRNPAKSVRVFYYGRTNSSDRTVYGRSHSFRSANSPCTDTVAVIVSASGSQISQSDSLWSAFQNATNAFSIEVIPLDDLLRLVVYHYVDSGIGVDADVHGSPELQVAQVSGSNVQVYITKKMTRGSGLYSYVLGRSRKRRTVRQFRIYRRLSGTTVPDQQALVETTNNATFLGQSTGSVLYLGARLERTNIDNGGTFYFEMVYEFLWISGGHYSIEGWQQLIDSTASVSAGGWVDVSTITGCGITASVPSASDFSPFLA